MVVTAAELAKEFSQLRNGTATRTTCSTGYPSLDPYIRFAKRYLAIITGYPSSGKSEWLDGALVNLSLSHQWKILYFSPENFPIQEHVAKLAEKLVGKPVRQFTAQNEKTALDFLNMHFAWIDLEYPTIDEIFAWAQQRKETLGLDCLVIDPWNGIRHERSGLREDEYLMEVLTRLLNFARRENVFLAIVAHPKNPSKDKDGKFPDCTLYDISGGAMWRNKADYGIVIHRPNMAIHRLEVGVSKLKQKWMGSVGRIPLDYDQKSGRFKDIDSKEFSVPHDSSYPF